MTIDELFEFCKMLREHGNGHKVVFVKLASWHHGPETCLLERGVDDEDRNDRIVAFRTI